MRIRDLILEVGTAGSTVEPATSDQQGEPKDVNKLTAMVTSLQKQIQDLQKSALQTSAQLKTPSSVGGSNTQQTQTSAPNTIKSVGTTPAGAAPAQTPQQASGTTAMQPAPKPTLPTQVPGVNQPAQITSMKIKQQLAQNQGKGT